jgi:cytidylate kinase
MESNVRICHEGTFTSMHIAKDMPVIIGLCGEAGTGKTTTADKISVKPPVSLQGVKWDHHWLSRPLYEMASIKRITEGSEMKDRILYGLHEVVADLFGNSPLYGAPSYETLVELVHQIYYTPISEGSEKPRKFLQTVGTLCREIYEDCFVNYIKSRIYQDFMNEDNFDAYITFVSDVRLPNEAKFVANHPQGMLIRLKASKNIREERLEKRDGFVISTDEASHASEAIDAIPQEYISFEVDTDDMTEDDQALAVQQLIVENIEELSYAETQ